MQAGDKFGYIAYGESDVYHHGALLSALKLLHHCPSAKVMIATDRPEIFNGYPVETLLLTPELKHRMSFNGRYHFGIKAGGMIELLKRAERLIFMDADMYPVGDISKGFQSISPDRSFMRLREGRSATYKPLAGRGIRIGSHVLTGKEVMWNSGVVGVHRDNLPALTDAYEAIPAVLDVVDTHTQEQFCIGVSLSRGRLSRHRLPIRNYQTAGKKAVALQRIREFFESAGDLSIGQQIAKAARHRLQRTPLDLWRQRHRWSF
ncbi:hypothetical protein EN812_05915 [Mesorhizobium sp. M4B.F.Ca.ET.169.01.1.1]|uniref:hypothetical protein n=1 Tax=Mesorhizobium sp. M4B.F.Ca.ET.169.01.1.1 TaxID=2563949 RepID=UPI0010940D97|nr:hypothetical protein [Mesorhizobium sp. M4B.F.Ca.ET.169.01.1.1]TGT46872.1 hypothetical protein EN812_05915 [Mesorhizobium sp. M4B.F.Ca.ET.169.01.1.1]